MKRNLFISLLCIILLFSAFALLTSCDFFNQEESTEGLEYYRLQDVHTVLEQEKQKILKI